MIYGAKIAVLARQNCLAKGPGLQCIYTVFMYVHNDLFFFCTYMCFSVSILDFKFTVLYIGEEVDTLHALNSFHLIMYTQSVHVQQVDCKVIIYVLYTCTYSTLGPKTNYKHM